MICEKCILDGLTSRKRWISSGELYNQIQGIAQIGVNAYSSLDIHQLIDAATPTIDDDAVSTTTIWSSDKINQEIQNSGDYASGTAFAISSDYAVDSDTTNHQLVVMTSENSSCSGDKVQVNNGLDSNLQGTYVQGNYVELVESSGDHIQLNNVDSADGPLIFNGSFIQANQVLRGSISNCQNSVMQFVVTGEEHNMDNSIRTLYQDSIIKSSGTYCVGCENCFVNSIYSLHPVSNNLLCN